MVQHKKRSFVLIIVVSSVCFIDNLYAQSILSSATLQFDVSKDIVMNEQALGSIRYNTKVSFNEGYLRTDNNLSSTVTITKISPCRGTKSQLFASNGSENYKMEDKQEIEIINLSTIGSSPSAFIYTNETAVINGFQCKKAICDTGSGTDINKTLEVWYTGQHRLAPGCFNYFFKELNGLPIKFSFKEVSKTQPVVTTNSYTLTSVTPGISNDEILKQPNEEQYVLVSDEVEKKSLLTRFASSAAKLTPTLVPKDNPNDKPSNSKLFEKTHSFKVGDLLSNFEGKTNRGSKIALADYRGKALVINFWFVACKPCLEEIPLLNQLKARYEGKNVSFLSVTFDDEESVNKFLKKTPFSFDMIVNAEKLTDQFGIIGYPLTIVVDKNRTVKHIESEGLKNTNKIEIEISKLLE